MGRITIPRKWMLLGLSLVLLTTLTATAVTAQGTFAAATVVPTKSASVSPAPTSSTPTSSAQATPAPTAAAAQGAAPQSPFLTMNPEGGFPLDPFLVSLQGGGPNPASSLAKGCMGYVTTAPSFSVDYRGKADMIRAFFYSDGAPVLIVQMPDGKFTCAAETTAQLLDPTLEMKKPAQGHYNIWVGSRRAKDLVPGFLVLTSKPEVRLGTFGLAGLVKRPTLPDVAPARERLAEAARLLAQAGTLSDLIKTLKPGDPPLTSNVTAQGNLPAYELTRGITLCNGLMTVMPSYAFSLSGDPKVAQVYFEGDADTTLLVRAPDGTFSCSDDADGTGNINPVLGLNQPANGRYLVWVGRIDPQKQATGKLTVALSDSGKPAILKKP